MTRRERTYKTEVVVLRRSDFGEADRLLTVFTPDRGKLRLIAKGARKPTSRKSGHVELFSHGEFLIAVGRDLDIVTQAETLEPYLPLREDLLRTTYAYYVAELADAFSAERDENHPLFDLIREALGWLCAAEGAPPADEAFAPGENLAGRQTLSTALALAARYYESRLLGLVGYQPQLFSCVGCKVRVKPEANYLSAADGGVLCPKCGAGSDRRAYHISLNALKILRFLQTRDWATCRLLTLSPASHDEVERLMNHYITYHLERQLKSVAFIQRLRRQMSIDPAFSGDGDSG
jgi:DNA repair protein RecO (recombination protein O)